MDPLIAVLTVVVAIAFLFEVAGRIGVPYPALFVLGGLCIGFVPAVPHITLDPELVLLVFLPPLLFSAAVETPLRDLRANIAPIARLSIGLVLFTMTTVAVVAQIAVPALGWAAAFTLGAILAPTDPLAATSVFRRLGLPRVLVTIEEAEGLLNDASALVAYRTAVVAALGGSVVLAAALGGFVWAIVGGVAIGLLVGFLFDAILERLDDPPVEVAVSLVIPFLAYLPAEQLGVSGVLAAVGAGLVVGRRLGTILSANSRVLWLTTWKMVVFLLNGFAFVLIGSALPSILAGLGDRPVGDVLSLVLAVSLAVIGARFAWIGASSLLPRSPIRVLSAGDRGLAWRLVVVSSWSGLRGAVSLAAALALPPEFPERNLVQLVTFAVILVTLVGQGLTLPFVVRLAGWNSPDPAGDEVTLARSAAYRAGLAEIERARPLWPTHQPLLDRLESGLTDRTQHLATDDPEETEEHIQERLEHEEIQRGVIASQRMAVIALRDRSQINDQTLRTIERELDLEEIRMEA